MLIGQTVYAPTGSAVYYSPWFPRQGDAFTALFEVLKSSGAFDLLCEIQTKNAEDADNAVGASLGSVTISSATTGEASVTSGCLELVRYKFTATAETSLQWVHFRSNPPMWQPN